jgi:ornithine carbamoyltransferase
MSGKSPVRDLLRVCDRSGEEIVALLDRAAWLSQPDRRGEQPTSLLDKRVAFIWDGEGFRNRAAFELGVREMGGVGIEIPGRLGEREALVDLAAYLDNWFDALVVRTPSFGALSNLAEAMLSPVVNARTGHNHPCEILGDLAYLQNARSSLDGLHLVFVGEATNLCHSWVEAAAVLPIAVTQVCPPGFEVDDDWWKALTLNPIGSFESTRDLADALSHADVIYTDCWPKAETETEVEAIRRAFGPLQVRRELLDLAPPAAVFLPCPPVTRGEEVDESALQSPKCRVVEAKKWLLYAQNALLEAMIGPSDPAEWLRSR